MEKHLLRVGEAAQMLNVSRWTIYRWVEEGRLEATKLNKGSLRVFHASLTALVDGNRMDEYEATRTARSSTQTPGLRPGQHRGMARVSARASWP